MIRAQFGTITWLQRCVRAHHLQLLWLRNCSTVKYTPLKPLAAITTDLVGKGGLAELVETAEFVEKVEFQF